MMFSEQLGDELVGAIMERGPMTEGSEAVISSAWIKGIKKGWKQEVNALKAVSEKNDTSKFKLIDFIEVGRCHKDTLLAIRRVTSWIRALRTDLNINKRMWTKYTPKEAQKFDSKTETVRARIQELFDQAEEVISDSQGKAVHWTNTLTPGTAEFKMDGGRSYEYASNDIANFRRIVNGIVLAPLDIATDVDKIISGKLFRLLNSLIVKVGKDEYPVDMKVAYEPQVVHLGKVTVVFEDSPNDGASPVKGARFSNYMGGRVDGKSRNPVKREKYIKALLKAHALLKRRGLDHLWYGRVVIMCKECGGKNQHGDQYGGVGAHYHRKGDWVSVYSNPDNTWIPYLMAHELGHRHYFKFMSARDRGQFDQWFKKVKPVSDYGGTVSEEDFAEVFAHYVDGKDLTGDQMGRLRAFLSRGKKLEQVEETDA